MALATADLSRIEQMGRGRSLWHYYTNDADTVVETDGYFDATYGVCNLTAGDIILANIDMDGTPELKVYMVSVGGADVTVVLASAS